DWRMPAALAATVAVGYAAYLSVGWRVLGFLPTYVEEEGLASGRGIYLLRIIAALFGVTIPVAAYVALAALVMAALAIAVVRRGRDRPIDFEGAPLLAIVGMLLASPHYAWYVLWVLPLLCFVPYWPMLYFSIAGFLIYLPHAIVIDWPAIDHLRYGGF